MTRTLGQVAELVRSKNAGPFWMTIDVFFSIDLDYRAACRSLLTNPDYLAAVYAIDPAGVEIFTIASLRAIKVSFPRPVAQGSVGDTDQHAGQQYVALLDIAIPDEP